VDAEDALFNKFSREHLPLSKQLQAYADRLRSRLNAMQLPQVAELTRQDVAKIVDGLRSEAPALGDPIGGWGGPGAANQYHTAVPVLAGAEFLRFWPDEVSDVEPIDTNDAAAATMWQTVAMRESPTERGIGTFIDLTPEEHAQEVNQPTLQRRFAERIDMATPVVEAIAQQVQRFFDEDLVDLGMDVVGQRRLNRSIAATLTFPTAWKIPAPKLITESRNPPDQPSGGVVDSSGRRTTEPAAESTAAEHVVPYRDRLDPATFEDVQRVTRIWADSIERYPAAYADLSEDRISDLLAATLNATLPGAQREVYSRGGKSDIFIQADVLAAGSSPAKVFICESKWSESKRWVSKAIDPQLYGYLTTHDTSAMLLLLFRQKSFDSARSNAYLWLRGVDGYLDEETGAVDDWPIFVFARGERTVRVCIASVHVAPTAATD
jgi:hypothetical protein